MSDAGATIAPLATCVLPAFNEQDVIAASIRTVGEVLSQRLGRYRWEIVVVDDGSSDATADEVVRAAVGSPHEVRLLRHRVNAGLGGALRTGFAASRGSVVITMDSDLSYAPGMAVEMVEAWERTGVHVVIASPYMPGGSTVAVPRALERRSRIANGILSTTATESVHTLTGMVRAYDGPFLRALALKAVDVDINVEIVYKTQLLRGTFLEIPATLDWSGLEGRAARGSLTSRRSRWNTAKSLVMSYLFRPFWFPLAPAILLLVVGLVLTALGRLGWSGLAVASLVLSVQLAFVALGMLQAKRYFEELFSQAHGTRSVLRSVPGMQPVVEVVEPPDGGSAADAARASSETWTRPEGPGPEAS